MKVHSKETISKAINDKVFSEKWEELRVAFQDANDTTAAILSAANIDRQMRVLLEAIFKEGNTTRNLLHSSRGRLGEYQIKADLLYVLEVIDKPTYSDISLIGNIRNIFGHSDSVTNFQSEEVFKLIERLQCVTYENGTTLENAKDTFLNNQAILLTKLNLLSKEVWHWSHET